MRWWSEKASNFAAELQAMSVGHTGKFY